MAGQLYALFLTATVWNAIFVRSYPSGAGDEACSDMLPRHDHAKPQTTASPFTVTQEFEASNYTVNTMYQVALHGDNGQSVTFEGFFCQGRSAGSAVNAVGAPLGTFVDFPGGIAHGKNCGGQANAGATHVNKAPKSLVVLSWLSPTKESGPIEIRCTILQDFSTFWQQVRPQVSEVPTLSPTVSEVPTSSPTGDLMQISFDGCGVTKSCFRRPSSCSRVTDCSFVYTHRMVTYSHDPTKAVVEIELAARLNNGQGWVAVGYSDDRHMGNDDVLACEVTPHGLVAAKNAWDRGKHNVIDNPNNGAQFLTNQTTTQKDGFVSCRFQRALKTPNLRQDFDLSEAWTLMFGTRRSGRASPNDALNGLHDRNPLTSREKVSANDTINISAAPEKRPLLTIHAILMVLSWTGASAVALFLARFMRNVWEKLLWFKFHRGLMVAVVLATAFGFAAIFVDVRRFSQEFKLHSALGIVTLCLAFIQPVMAFFRCAPDNDRRWIYNWAHRIVGILVQTLAIFNIFLGLAAFRDLAYEIGQRGIIILALWFCLVLIVWVGLEVYNFFKRRTQQSQGYYPMSNMSNVNEDEPAPDETPSAGDYRVHRVTFAIFVAICILLSVALAVVIAVSTSD